MSWSSINLVNLVNVTPSGNSITKNNANGWDAGASSLEKIYGDGGIRFTVPLGSNVIAGLSESDPDQNYTSMKYGIYPWTDNNLYIIENGSQVGGAYISYIATDVLSVEKVGSTIYYKKNNITFYTSTIASSNPLVFDSSIDTNGNSINNIEIDYTPVSLYTFDIIFKHLVNATDSGNSITKTTADGWDAGGSSTYMFNGDGGVSFQAFATNQDIMCGLSKIDNNASYTSINFAICLTASGIIDVYENGAFKGAFGSYLTSDIFTVESMNNHICYKKNGTIFYISLGTPNSTLLVDTSIYTNGASIDNVQMLSTIDIPSLTDAMPSMTSDTTPSGIVTTSDTDPGFPRPSYYFCDDDDDNLFLSKWNDNPVWFQYQFPTAKTIIAFSITYKFTYDNRRPTQINFQGSNNGTSWTTIHTSEAGDLFDATFERKVIQVENSTAYDYYRINFLYFSNNWTEIAEVELLESGTPSESISDSIILDDTWLLQLNPDNQAISDSIILDDDWSILSNPDQENSSDILDLSDQWFINKNPEDEIFSENVFLSDNWFTDLTGEFSTIFNTQLNTVLNSFLNIFTDLRTSFFTKTSYQTHLNLKVLEEISYSTDLRTRNSSYDLVPIGTLNDFIVKLDGTELLDVDYNTLNITLNLNTTPSRAEFVLARRHDNLDKMLDGSTSIITANNKIQIYDGIILLFTGYISEINADSSTDTVTVIAEDVRRQLSQISFELEYGGAYLPDSNHNGIPDEIDTNTDNYNDPSYIKKDINTYHAFTNVITEVGSLISGVDDYSFLGSYTPEYTKNFNDCNSFIDQLVRQTANANWYIDENERLKFQKIDNGQIKNIPLSSLNLKRHPYDLILSNVQLNKMPVGYAQSLTVKRGYNDVKTWRRQEFKGYINFDPSVLQQSSELSYIDFQVWGQDFGVNRLYVGINQIIYGAVGIDGWILLPIVDVQWAYTSHKYLPDITIGAGLPNKTLFLQSYGVKSTNAQWTEAQRQTSYLSPTTTWLVHRTEAFYDLQNYLLDLANFELSQNNKKVTSATASMLLDAYEYYNLNFADLINFTNTLQINIYKDNNGFPLNINGIQIDCSKRIVTLNLTNYGKSWYVKTKSYIANYTPPSIQYIFEKQPVQQYIP
jgi:hypothetical protein